MSGNIGTPRQRWEIRLEGEKRGTWHPIVGRNRKPKAGGWFTISPGSRVRIAEVRDR